VERTRWWVGASLLVLAGCGSGAVDGGSAGDNPATGIAPPTTEAAASAPEVDWTLPTGVFRAVTPEEGTLELHIEPGRFVLYDVTDGSADLGYAADCVPDDEATITCTEDDGVQLSFAWSGTADSLVFRVTRGGEQGDHDVWEPVPWVRVA
jgi:hypothetical protein